MIVCTAGHIDHGKTALVKALTGTDTDRLAEEKARGITIDLGFAYTDLGTGSQTAFVDVPGHERLIHTMLAGVGGGDFALLVVAADDGVMPQTREHLAILSLLGLSRGVVVLSKSDLADDARRSTVTRDLKAVLAGSPLAAAPIVPVSVLTGEGIEPLRQIIAQAEAATVAPDSSGLFRLVVDRCFTLPGTGTVVTGTVLNGSAMVGDPIMVSPAGLPARIRSIHALGRVAEQAVAGQRCALNIAGERISKDAISRGDVVVSPVLHAPTTRIDAELSVLPSETRALGTWFPGRLHTLTTETGVRIVPLDGVLEPGGPHLVQLVLDRPIAAATLDRFILRDVSARRTIGGGRFLDLRPPARKRSTPERLALLSAARQDSPSASLAGMIQIAPVDLAGFLRDRCLPVEIGPSLPPVGEGVIVGGTAISAASLNRLAADLTERLAGFHVENPDILGMGRERLRTLLSPRLAKEVFLAFLRREVSAGRIVLKGAFVALPGQSVTLTRADADLFARIFPTLQGDQRFRPPRVRDLAASLGEDEARVRRILKLTQKMGQTDQIAQDHFFDRATTREMVGLVKDVAAEAPDGWFAAAAFRDRMDNGRKVAIQILDFFDRLGLTLRRGDLRRINPHRADLFDD